MRRGLLLLLLAGAPAAAQQAEPEIAIEGLDPVLLVEGRESQGRNEITSLHGGLAYLFASPQTRARFEADPRRYAAQLDGACARMGPPTFGNPDLYAVHEGRIYLFGSGDCLRAFQAAPAKYLEPERPPLARNPEAERRAQALLDEAVAWIGGAERLRRLAGYELRSRLVETRSGRELVVSHHTTAVFPASIRDETRAPWGEFTYVAAPQDAFLLTPRGTRPLHHLQRRELETAQRRLPFVILRSRGEPGFVAVHAGSAQAGAAAVEDVELELAGQRMRLGIESTSGRVLSLAYRGRHQSGEVGSVVELYSDFRSAFGLTLPYRSTASVDGAPLRVLSRRGEQELVVALEAATGATAWEHAYNASFSSEYDMQHGPGPHATPLVTGGRVFAVGATGALHALDQASGRPLWRRDLIRELGGTLRPNGYACSPIAFGDTVILFVGGKNQAVVAFRQADGRVAWQSGDFRNSASSPLLIDVADEPQLVAFLYEEVAGFDPRDGRLLWRHPHVTEFGLNVSLPVWGGDGLLFVSAAYGGGSRVLRVTREAGRPAVEELWHSRLMRLHFGNAIRLGDFVVGSSGDFGPAPLTAIDVRTGQVLWRNRSLARASLLRAGERLILLDEDGQLALASATRHGLEVHAKFQLFDGLAWTVPTLDGAVLYARDRNAVVALDLK